MQTESFNYRSILSTPTFAWILTLFVIQFTIRIFASSRKKDESNIPWAPGAIPILGHALKYRKNPPAFLLSSAKQVGDLFRINMSGKHMIVACGPRTQRIVASSPESIMSAREAIADIGFEETLGYLNVYQGTDLHKGIVKGLWHSNGDTQVTGFIQAVRNSLTMESASSSTPKSGNKKVEFLSFVRRVILRASIERFIGSSFLDGWDDFSFIEVFMKFQDDLEDVTAKAAVMPQIIASPLLLSPLKRRRLNLQKVISKRLQTICSIGDDTTASKQHRGFWLAEIKDSYHPDEIAELIIGLLFAAHKNPAIGTAQSYLMLCELATPEQRKKCADEAKAILSNPNYEILQKSCPTLNRLCLESLRLTAHSIGAVRTAKQSFSVGEKFTIPKGATVALTHISSSLNTKYWNDPNAFDIDVESKNRSQELYDNDYIFSVFSHGVHKCPGQKFAKVMLKLTVAILLHEYKITLPESIPPLCFERATLAQRAGPVEVTISKNEEK
jgi:cytochrome P450